MARGYVLFPPSLSETLLTWLVSLLVLAIRVPAQPSGRATMRVDDINFEGVELNWKARNRWEVSATYSVVVMQLIWQGLRCPRLTLD